jgi:hypothetical protein
MRFLWIIDRHTYNTKMSRVRFHGMDALKRQPGVWLKVTGPKWPDFNIKTVIQDNNPDFIIWYKPLDMRGWEHIANSNVPTILRYNEMWDNKWTTKEITKTKTKIVVCHHKNDIPKYGHIKARLYHNPHCAEKEIFKDYGLPKKYDILLVGVMSQEIYPLRELFKREIFPRLQRLNYKCKILKHPGYRVKHIGHQVKHYAKLINQAKIACTCASIYHYALAKYAEIPLCNTLLCGDLPGERQEWYRKWMLHVDRDINNIMERITKYLKNPEKLKAKTKLGRELNLKELGRELNLKDRTQEHYAQRMIEICNDFRANASI